MNGEWIVTTGSGRAAQLTFDDPPPASRRDDHLTSVSGEAAVAFRSSSQKAKLLHAYSDASSRGMTAIEACRAAGLSASSCYWKRVSELLHGGYIEPLVLDGKQITRMGELGSRREVYVITARGSALLRSE